MFPNMFLFVNFNFIRNRLTSIIYLYTISGKQKKLNITLLLRKTLQSKKIDKPVLKISPEMRKLPYLVYTSAFL